MYFNSRWNVLFLFGGEGVTSKPEPDPKLETVRLLALVVLVPRSPLAGDGLLPMPTTGDGLLLMLENAFAAGEGLRLPAYWRGSCKGDCCWLGTAGLISLFDGGGVAMGDTVESRNYIQRSTSSICEVATVQTMLF